MWRGLGALLGLPLLAAIPAGCTVTTDPPTTVIVAPTEPTGTLVVDWTIEGRADPADCGLTGADAIEVHVVATTGFDAGTFQQSCGAFATSIVLVTGTYTATAQLLDIANQPRTTAVTIAPFTIYGDDQFGAPIDFPVDSFF